MSTMSRKCIVHTIDTVKRLLDDFLLPLTIRWRGCIQYHYISLPLSIVLKKQDRHVVAEFVGHAPRHNPQRLFSVSDIGSYCIINFLKQLLQRRKKKKGER